MTPVALFRTATLGSFALALLGGGIDLLPGMVPEEVDAAAFETVGVGQLVAVAIAILLLGTASLVATIGLALFAPWSRTLAVVSTVASLAVYPLLPPMTQSGWASMLYYLSTFGWGVAIAMAYFSPLSARFARGGSPVMQTSQ